MDGKTVLLNQFVKIAGVIPADKSHGSLVLTHLMCQRETTPNMTMANSQ